MGSPTLVANPFSLNTSNYLLSPKLGQKRTFPTFGKDSFRPHSVSVDLPIKSEQICTSNPYSYLDMSKYHNRIPYQIPPLKKPAIVGGFLGAKSQSLREESSKILWDILKNMAILSAGSEYSGFESKDISMTENYIQSLSPEPGKDRSNNNTISDHATAPQISKTENHKIKMEMCVQNVCSDASVVKEGKPPMKKPKLKLPCNRQSSKAKRHKSRRKYGRRSVQCDPVIQSPGYDPTQTTFEFVDETDCGIALSNRFSPLENECSNFQSVSESPSDCPSEFPILNKLSDMHIDDFEVEFDNSGPEFCDIHCYEPSDSMDYNSSIAFILSGNDDIASDSEDGSFASDLDDIHWQTFKANFELYQDNIPLPNIILGSCGVTELVFQADFEEMADDIFLNDLSDTALKLREVNLKWNELDCGKREKLNSSKVCFAPEDHLVSVCYIPSGPEELHARKSSWEQAYLDRCRFKKRIEEVEPIISLCLAPQHRKSVFRRLYGQTTP